MIIHIHPQANLNIFQVPQIWNLLMMALQIRVLKFVLTAAMTSSNICNKTFLLNKCSNNYLYLYVNYLLSLQPELCTYVKLYDLKF